LQQFFREFAIFIHFNPVFSPFFSFFARKQVQNSVMTALPFHYFTRAFLRAHARAKTLPQDPSPQRPWNDVKFFAVFQIILRFLCQNTCNIFSYLIEYYG